MSISTSAVQVVNLGTALLAAGGGQSALGAALVGINLTNLLLNLVRRPRGVEPALGCGSFFEP